MMGFLTGNKTTEERIQEKRAEILNEGQVIIELANGTHGADEIVAGAMMGETGKYLAMAKYGETKWQSTILLIYPSGIRIHYTGAEFFYNELKGFETVHKGWLDTEFIMHTIRGPILFKLFNETFEALKLVIEELKEKYLNELEQEKINQQQKEEQEKTEEKIDRLIELGKMHEKGLLTDEEFMSMKGKIMEDDNDLSENDIETSQNLCKNCGSPISKDSNFCTECGNPVK